MISVAPIIANPWILVDDEGRDLELLQSCCCSQASLTSSNNQDSGFGIAFKLFHLNTPFKPILLYALVTTINLPIFVPIRCTSTW